MKEEQLNHREENEVVKTTTKGEKGKELVGIIGRSRERVIVPQLCGHNTIGVCNHSDHEPLLIFALQHTVHVLNRTRIIDVNTFL